MASNCDRDIICLLWGVIGVQKVSCGKDQDDRDDSHGDLQERELLPGLSLSGVSEELLTVTAVAYPQIGNEEEVMYFVAKTEDEREDWMNEFKKGMYFPLWENFHD